MAKKIKLQHLYTQTGNTAPTGNDALGYGEIAIAHKTGEEAIFIKNNGNGEEVKFIPKTQIDELISAATNGLATDGNISALTTDLSNHKNLKGDDISGSIPTFGHVALKSGDIGGVTGYTKGFAAASYHTHGQYFTKDNISNGLETWKKTDDAKEMLRVKAAANGGIIVDTNGVSINSELKDRWENAADAINAFLNNEAAISGAVDTLKEIQQFLDGTGSTVQTLLNTLDDLTNTVTGNTSDITSLSGDVTSLSGIVTNLGDKVNNKVETIEVNGNLFASGTTSGNVKKYTITHTAASTQASSITATNSTTGLSHGSHFTIVDKIAYDANGHVVSGSTKTLSLPNLPTATEELGGIVKLRSGLLTLEDEFLNENKDYLTTAASVAHAHSEYVKYTDLNNYEGTTPLVISCGTY